MSGQSEQTLKVIEALSASPKLLYIEDDPDDRALFKRLLEPYSVVLDEADDGKTGVKAAIEGDYALVVLDMYLPDMTATDTFQQIRVAKRAQGKWQRMIVVSAAFNMEAQAILRASGFISFALKDKFLKPELVDEMMGRVGIVRSETKA
jgi:CheY-like chemotaxis protein